MDVKWKKHTCMYLLVMILEETYAKRDYFFEIHLLHCMDNASHGTWQWLTLHLLLTGSCASLILHIRIGWDKLSLSEPHISKTVLHVVCVNRPSTIITSWVGALSRDYSIITHAFNLRWMQYLSECIFYRTESACIEKHKQLALYHNLPKIHPSFIHYFWTKMGRGCLLEFSVRFS